MRFTSIQLSWMSITSLFTLLYHLFFYALLSNLCVKCSWNLACEQQELCVSKLIWRKKNPFQILNFEWVKNNFLFVWARNWVQIKSIIHTSFFFTFLHFSIFTAWQMIQLRPTTTHLHWLHQIVSRKESNQINGCSQPKYHTQPKLMTILLIKIRL